jgi:glutamate-1-semialdehyde 2,1-aminomutase
MKIVALVQARMGSTRLPGKVLRPITDIPMIEILLSRLSKSDELDEIVVATSDHVSNDELQSIVEALGYKCTRGSEKDVLKRFYDAAKLVRADVIVRITADCPLVDPSLVDECIKEFRRSEVDYVSNTSPPTYPDGLDVEVFSFASIERANIEAHSDYDREHVTPYIRTTDCFTQSSIKHSEDFSHVRLTVDEPEDLSVVVNVYEYFAPDINFSWHQVMDLKDLRPEMFMENQKFKRNEGATMGTGQKLYDRAKRVIPGGTMLLSKRPEMFLPEKWPAYFSSAKGCRVWDLDNKEYIDMSIMGIGTNTLGYGHPEVDEAVMQTIQKGNMSTLNCPEEVYLAEKLIEMHPWAEMARFARSGGEANAISIRIARAATGRDKVAICGYHGWHDWYLSTNLQSGENLDNHLLPGLESKGVPRVLAGTTLPFNYNNLEQLESLIEGNKGEIAAIKMEVSRRQRPKDNFLQKVRNLATKNGIVLIFDECTSGFRETFGGLHKKYGVEPDMAMFGKTLGNGYAINAIIGSQAVMSEAQSTFISSTFWTERIGPAAALKALEVMEREKSWETITSIGINISNRWISLAKKYELSLDTFGLPAIGGFTFNSPDALAYKTLITQEMLKKGYLAGNSVYACIEHTDELIDGYFTALDPIFETIKNCEDGLDVMSILEGPICHNGFARLN